MGRLTKDAEVRYTTEGKAIANFSLAVDRKYDREHTDFFILVAFGKTAEFAQKYLTKGTKIVASGRLQNDNYQDKDGKMVYQSKIYVEEVEFAESKGSKPQEQPKADDGFLNIDDCINSDELPFI